MTTKRGDGIGPKVPLPDGWGTRVKFAEGARYAYVPDQVLVVGLITAAQGAEMTGTFNLTPGTQVLAGLTPVQVWTAVPPVNVPRLVLELRALGVQAQPNHVLFADSCGCGCCPPHPALVSGGGLCGSPVWASPVWASPVWASPVWASPVWASPVWASPVWANPVWASPVWASASCANPVWASPVWASRSDIKTFLATGNRRSTAAPADDPVWSAGTVPLDPPRITIFDTGFAASGFRPDFLPQAFLPPAPMNPDADLPDVTDGVNPADNLLDPVAGHGTFIAGIIERIQSGCELSMPDVVHREGDIDEFSFVTQLSDLADLQPGERPHIINMSMSGYAPDGMAALRVAVEAAHDAEIVMVASAGNDGTCTPTYPASLPHVIGVGAIGPGGPAFFTNYGGWVRACAPGVDIVSTFFNFNGDEAPVGGKDPDGFAGWAKWSGTSFSAPMVVGALARAMVDYGISAQEAVERVIDAPELMRIPNLGTVVNVSL